MKKNALLCGTINALSVATAVKLEEKGWTVTRILAEHLADNIAKTESELDTIDMIIYFSCEEGISRRNTIRDGLNYDEIIKVYEKNTLNFLRVVQTFRKQLSQSSLKRICIVTGETASINYNRNSFGFGASMSQAALNNLTGIMSNLLRKEGFTFRLLCVNEMNDEKIIQQSAGNAIAYFLRNRSYDAHLDDRFDEDRVVLRDITGRELPW